MIDICNSANSVSIAKVASTEVYQYSFGNYVKQYMYGVENTNVDTVWTLRNDADERFTEESTSELEMYCNENMDTDVAGIMFKVIKWDVIYK